MKKKKICRRKQECYTKVTGFSGCSHTWSCEHMSVYGECKKGLVRQVKK